MRDMTPWEAMQFEESMKAPEFKRAGEVEQGRHAWYCGNCGEVQRSQVDGTHESCLLCGSHVKWVRV